MIQANCRAGDTVFKAHAPPLGACDNMISASELLEKLQDTKNFIEVDEEDGDCFRQFIEVDNHDAFSRSCCWTNTCKNEHGPEEPTLRAGEKKGAERRRGHHEDWSPPRLTLTGVRCAIRCMMDGLEETATLVVGRNTCGISLH